MNDSSLAAGCDLSWGFQTNFLAHQSAVSEGAARFIPQTISD